MLQNGINNGLSLHQKSHLNVTAFFSFRNTLQVFMFPLLISACTLSLYGILASDFVAHTTNIKDQNQGPTITLFYGKHEILIVELDILILVLSVVISIPVILWQLYRGRNIYRRFKELDKEYLSRMYLLIFETSVPHGTNSGEKVLHLARSVFPELRSDYLYMSPSIFDKIKRWWKKRAVKTDQEIIEEASNFLVDSYSLDLALKTTAGYFIVKDFGDKTVTSQDIKQLISIARKIISTKWGWEKVFRIVCVGKQYDKPFLQQDSLEQMMKKEVLPIRHRLVTKRSDFPIDLLVNEATGFSILWID